MTIEQYQGLLHLVSGVSLFIIMLLVLRLISKKNEKNSAKSNQEEWVGLEDLIVVDIVNETHNIKSFKFKRKNNLDFPNYKAGQFLSFQVGDDAKLVRSYSLSSSDNKKVLQVSVKLIPNGLGSSWFHQLKIGEHVKAHPPSGHFTDESENVNDRVFIAGGVGITPIFSIIQSNIEDGKKYDMFLFYGVRTQRDLAFHEFFQYYARVNPAFKYFPVISDDPTWLGDKGHLNLKFIADKVGHINNQYFYICGPDPMSDPILDELDKLSVPVDHIFSERFVSPASFDPSQISERNVKVKWMGQEYNYEGRENILTFLESQNQFLPNACRAGVCGSCKCKITGKYKMLTDAGLTRKEQKEGYALACVTFPESDIEIDISNN